LKDFLAGKPDLPTLFSINVTEGELRYQDEATTIKPYSKSKPSPKLSKS
jgi:hypothetical protein